MKERPIIFSPEMIRAILEGRKTQTRRVVKPQPMQRQDGAWIQPVGSQVKPDCPEAQDPPYGWGQAIWSHPERCPHGVPGDRLWVREAWRYETDEIDDDENRIEVNAVDVRYLAGPDEQNWCEVPDASRRSKRLLAQLTKSVDGRDRRWHPSIHMPRWASRILLELTNVRARRVQEITENDAIAEGVTNVGNYEDRPKFWASAQFSRLWDSINAKRGYGWDTNPWVWALTFKVLEVKGVTE